MKLLALIRDAILRKLEILELDFSKVSTSTLGSDTRYMDPRAFPLHRGGRRILVRRGPSTFFLFFFMVGCSNHTMETSEVSNARAITT